MDADEVKAALADAVQRIKGDLTDEQVTRVVTALGDIYSGTPVGTVYRDGTSVAVRVNHNGLPKWAVVAENGAVRFEVSTQFPGEKLADPVPADERPEPEPVAPAEDPFGPDGPPPGLMGPPTEES
jgi:hypothetical protein